jgi:hypothetical protein
MHASPMHGSCHWREALCSMLKFMSLPEVVKMPLQAVLLIDKLYRVPPHLHDQV